jgi:DNA-binding PadR family transcriptional regulator
MRRKPGTLIPIEVSILGAGLELSHQGLAEFHGYAIAKEIRDREAARRLAAQGTLYRALDRLEGLRLLESRLEEPDVAAAENRPRRRLYKVTALGEQAYAAAPRPTQALSSTLRKGTAPA